MEDGQEDLCDDLLIEILSRIRSTPSALQCKLVCKRWYSLMSTPRFVSRFRFIASQRLIEHGDDDDDDDGSNSSYQSLCIVVTGLDGRTPHQTVRVALQNHDPSNLVALNLDNCLPVCTGYTTLVLASCDDLILCQSQPDGIVYRNYSLGFPTYLCNPFTKQWVALKPPPPAGKTGLRDIRFGLVYELSADICRYRVVQFLSVGYFPATRIEISTYYSETCQWVQSEQLVGEKYSFGSEIAAYNGKLHWVNTDGTCVHSYDPFNKDREHISSIDGPYLNSGREWNQINFLVEECDGVLRVVRFQRFKRIAAWELEADRDGRRSWSLKHDICTVFLSNTYRYALGLCLGLKKNVVFMIYDDVLISHTFQTGEFKIEGELRPDVGKLGGWMPPTLYRVFLPHLPWWPTPIPKPTDSYGYGPNVSSKLS